MYLKPTEFAAVKKFQVWLSHSCDECGLPCGGFITTDGSDGFVKAGEKLIGQSANNVQNEKDRQKLQFVRIGKEFS